MIQRMLNRQLIIFIILLSSIFSFSQNHSEITFSLNGTWDIIFDNNNEGVKKKWYLDKNFEKHDSKKSIKVPSCWEETEKNYEGAGIYRTKFTIPKSWKDKIIHLNFEAVNYKTEVWLNDQVVGFHEGGYTPFNFRVDKLAKVGKENTLVVRVVSPIILTDKYIDGMGRQEVPMWRGAITGGIWQDVSIVAKGQLGLKDVFVQPNIHTDAVSLEVEIDNTETTVDASDVTVNIYSKQGKVIVTKNKKFSALPGKNKFRFDLKIPNATSWSPESPYLYKAEVIVKKAGKVSDRWSHKFGMREFTVENDQFYLNGKPLYLKATFFEGLYPVRLAYPDSEEMARKEIQLAKDAGFNMIRPWRKPASKMWLDLCDEMGVLTVGSLAVECMLRPISTPRLSFVVENELRETILNNRNRTCIVQWELFNEINRPILAQMLNSMSVLARELDPTRMVLDESGGWGEGANIYLPNQRTPKKFNDIHHYSGSQVNEEEFNGYLATAKTKEEKKQLGLTGIKSYGKNVVPGIMTYVSEIGYGSTPNLIENNKEFAAKGNPLVAPTIYHNELDESYKTALKKVGFDKIYPETEAFYLEQQKMHGIANKRMLEATRLNTTVAGYCVHALVGGDWVIGAGLLDLWRNPKTLVYDLTREANQPQIAPIRILPRNIYAEKGASLEIHGVNELASENVFVTVIVRTTKGRLVSKEHFTASLKNGVSLLRASKLDTRTLKGSYEVYVELRNSKGKIITKNSQYFDVFSQKQLATPKTSLAIVDIDNSLSKFFNAKGIVYEEFSTNTSKDKLVIVGKANKKEKNYKEKIAEVLDFVKSGGKAIFLEVDGKRVKGFGRELREISTNNPLEMEVLPKWPTLGGWAAKSHITTKHPILKGLPTEQIMHGVYENVHPHTSLSKLEGDYIVGLIGYDHFPNNDVMIRHYNGPGEVWWAADVLQKKVGEGKAVYSTLRILSFLGKDPVAEKILYNMINYLD